MGRVTITPDNSWLSAMIIRRSSILLALAFLSPLHAEVVPGRWEKVAAQTPGTGLTIVMESGDQLECSFSGLEQGLLVVETDSGERRLRKEDIQKIETTQEVADPVRDGTVRGLAIGAGAGGILGAAVGSTVAGIFGSKGNQIAGGLVVGAIGAGIGAGIGAAIGFAVDKAESNERPEVLYVAL